MITTAEPMRRERAERTNLQAWAAVERFCAWLDASGGVSYDPYDLSGTRYGRWARRLYYKKNPLGTVFSAPLVLAEIAAPWIRPLFVKKGHFATADAQLALAFLNLHALGETLHCPDETSPLARAKELAEGLLQQSIAGYRGHCWGYPFDWQHVNGLMPKGTPHITATPYCYEVFARLFEATGDERYLDVTYSIAEFVYNDINDTPTGEDAAAASYTPHDHSKVVNASAYRAMALFDAAQRFRVDAYVEKAWKNLRFILQSQQADGSWLYAIDNPPEAFIDHFHTCFVLKNLFKINSSLHNGEVKRAVQRGYGYYRAALFDGDKPKTYAIAPRVQIVRTEMYNVAEAITLCSLLKDEISGSFELAQTLARRLVSEYQLPAGHWVTRIYLGGIRHTTPFLRWPQSQLFHALTQYLMSESSAS